MKKYCLGFIFDTSLRKVLLVHKLKPDWQKGKVNGMGGKVENGETSLEAIVREVKEESNLSTNKESWIHIGVLKSPDWVVDIYTYVYNGKLTDAKCVEEERNAWYTVDQLPPEVITNLTWLIPFALDKIQKNEFSTLLVTYT